MPPTEPVGGVGLKRTGPIGFRHCFHRVIPPGRHIPAGLTAAHSQLPLDRLVVRCEFVVIERPIRERTALRHPVGGRHSEVERVETPSLGAVNPRTAADAHSVVLVRAVVGPKHARSSVRRDENPRIAVQLGPGVVPVAAEPMVAEVVPPGPTRWIRLAAIQNQHAFAALGELPRSHPATGAGADDNDIEVAHRPVTTKPISAQEPVSE